MLFLLVVLGGCGRDGEERETLVIFAAASLTDAVEEIGEAFQATHPVELVYNFASSGALARQIQAAPRADVYLSANQHWMDVIEESGEVLPGSRRTILHNQLVLVGNADSGFSLSDPRELPSLDFSYLAIGDPAHVPAGLYAEGWLKSLKTSDGKTVWDALEGRMSLCPDVRAALFQAEMKRDILAVVYRSDYLPRANALRLIYEVPLAKTASIDYSAAILVGSKQPELGEEFLTFLSGPQARAIFIKNGFIVPEN